ncbi:MAG: hypothetical protein GX766_03045 [Firmicutes bacterium]|nr:hypothetical protein [Bacillota bacterium]
MGKKLFSLIVLLALAAWPVLAASVEGEFSFSFEEETPAASDFQLNLELQEEVKKLQGKIEELQGQLELANRQKSDLYSALTRIEIKGTSVTDFRNFHLKGPGAGSALDFLGRPLWHDPIESEMQLTGSKGNERVSLLIVGRPIPQIEVGGDIEFIYTWAGGKQLTPSENIYIKADFGAWQTLGGTYWAQFSPLTLFYPLDQPKFESDIFAQKRSNWLAEQKIKGNSRRLEGFRGQFQVDNLKVTGLVGRVAKSPYHRFLWGLEGVLAVSPALELTGNFVSYKDDIASATAGSAADSLLLGLAANWQLRKNLSWQGEIVRSSYNSNILGDLPPAFDQAFTSELTWKSAQLQLQSRLINVGPFYYAPTAQSRDYALTNASIFGPTTARTAMGGLVAEAANEALPYGLATPNRKGIQFAAAYTFQSGATFLVEHWQLSELRPSLDDGRLTDQFATTRNYYVEKIGGELPLTKIIRHSIFSLPQKETKLTGQWERRRTVRPADPESGAASQINRTELISDLGLSYELAPGWDLLVGGKRQIWQEDLAEKSQDSIGAGLRIRVNPTAIFQLSWDKYLSEDADGTIYGLHVKAEF